MLKRSASNIINSTSTSTRSASNRYLTYFFFVFVFLTICLTIDVGKVFIESCVAPGCDVIQGSAMVKGDEAGFLCHILEKRKIIYTICTVCLNCVVHTCVKQKKISRDCLIDFGFDLNSFCYYYFRRKKYVKQ